MVSIRRRKLLGLWSGRNSLLMPLPKFSEMPLPKLSENEQSPEKKMQNSKPVSVHLMPSSNVGKVNEKTSIQSGPGSSSASASAESKEHNTHQIPEIKRRKRHRRKHSENHESCLMRGVYFKNMKWQAAIKVEKKQIHLGTVGSQEEAARLYDRAAFMCGREPNFELTEEEKDELRKFNWDQFLASTRSAITSKKQPRRNALNSRRTAQNMTQKNVLENEVGGGGGGGGGEGLSASDEAMELEIQGS